MACLNNNFGLIGKSTSKILYREMINNEAEFIVYYEFMPHVENVGMNHICRLPAMKLYSDIIKVNTNHTWSNGAYTIGESYSTLVNDEYILQQYQLSCGIHVSEFYYQNNVIRMKADIDMDRLLQFIN